MNEPSRLPPTTDPTRDADGARLPYRFREHAPEFASFWDSWAGRWILPTAARPTRAQLRAFGSLLLEGDPTAEAVAELDDELGAAENRRQLELALERGIDAVPDPHPALVALFREVDEEPVWLDRDLLEIAAGLHQRVGALAGFVLRDLALMGGYVSSALAKPLVFTGSLERGADGRLAETGTFWLAVTRSGGMERFAEGRQVAVRVRVMHARLRRRIRSHPDWSDQKWGVPINQGDLLSTNQAFSALLVGGLRLLGVSVSDRESDAVMHLWRIVGCQLGIRPELLPSTERDGRRILYMTTMTHPPADDDSRALARALLDEPRGATRNPWPILGALEAGFHHGLSRFFLDATTCRELAIGPTPWVLAGPLLTAAMLPLELARRTLPGGTALAVAIGGLVQATQNRTSLAGRRAAFEPVRELARDAKA